MGSLGMLLGGMIALMVGVILYWAWTAEPPPAEEQAAPSEQGAPQVCVSRFQVEGAAELTPGILLRRERYLVDTVVVPRPSREMTTTLFLLALGTEAVDGLEVKDLKDPDDPDLPLTLIESHAIPDLVELLEERLKEPRALAERLVKLLDQGDPEQVTRVLTGEAEPTSAGVAAEEAAALTREVLRQAQATRDAPHSLLIGYRGPVTPLEPERLGIKPALSEDDVDEITQHALDWAKAQDRRAEHGGGWLLVWTTPDEEGAGVMAVAVPTLLAVCRERERGEWREAVQEHLERLLRVQREARELPQRSLDEVANELRVRVLSADLPGLETMISREDAAGTRSVLVYASEGATPPVPVAALEAWGRSSDELLALGLEQVLAQHPLPEPEQVEVAGVQLPVYAGDDPFVLTHALLLEKQPELLGPEGALVVLVSERELAVLPLEEQSAAELSELLGTLERVAARLRADDHAQRGAWGLEHTLYRFRPGQGLTPLDRSD